MVYMMEIFTISENIYFLYFTSVFRSLRRYTINQFYDQSDRRNPSNIQRSSNKTIFTVNLHHELIKNYLCLTSKKSYPICAQQLTSIMGFNNESPIILCKQKGLTWMLMAFLFVSSWLPA